MKLLVGALILFLALTTAWAQNLQTISLSDDVVSSGGSALLTVKLESAAAGQQVVELISTSPSLNIPPSVTFSSGQISASVQITAGTVSNLTPGSILAKKGNKSIEVDAQVSPASYSIPINLLITPTNSAFLLDWSWPNDLLLGTTFSGFEVWMEDLGQQVKVSTMRSKSDGFVHDAESTRVPPRPVTRKYQVRLINRLGVTVSSSPWVTSTCTIASQVPWITPPAITGNVVQGKINGGTLLPTGTLYVDGFRTRSVSYAARSGSGASELEFKLPTNSLNTGKHVFRLVQPTGSVSIQATCNVTTQHQVFSGGDVISSDRPRTTFKIDSSVPAATWRVRILDSSESIVADYTGTGSICHFAWDGSTVGGDSLPNGTYGVTIAFDSGASQKVGRVVIARAINIKALFLVTYFDDDSFTILRDYINDLKRALLEIKLKDSSFDYLVLEGYEDFGSSPTVVATSLKKWLSTPEVFYYYGHGTPFGLMWNGVVLKPEKNLLPSGIYEHESSRAKDLVCIEAITEARQFPFRLAYLDSCNTYVSGSTGDKFRLAFGITNPDQGYIGMSNVTTPVTNWKLVVGGGYAPERSIWYDYTIKFWNNVAAGMTIINSESNARATCVGPVNGTSPKTAGLVRLFGGAFVLP